jgi:hypothetical protein
MSAFGAGLRSGEYGQWQRLEVAVESSGRNPVGQGGRAAPATALIEMARGYQLSQALFVAAQLGIADLLADGPLCSGALATATNTHPLALHRLLRLLASRGLLAEVGDREFALTSFGELLRRDLPGSAHAQVLRAAGLLGRCQVTGGDFFTDLPPGADAYVLSNVLMDWEDPAAIRLLRECRAAMGPHGTLLVVERVIAADNRASLSQLGDLMGLVVTGGRVRSESEFDELFATAGLVRTRSVATDSGYAILEAHAFNPTP